MKLAAADFSLVVVVPPRTTDEVIYYTSCFDVFPLEVVGLIYELFRTRLYIS